MTTELTPEEYARAVQLAVVVAENGCVLIEASRAADIFANALLLAHAQRRTASEGTVWREVCEDCLVNIIDARQNCHGTNSQKRGAAKCPLRKSTP